MKVHTAKRLLMRLEVRLALLGEIHTADPDRRIGTLIQGGLLHESYLYISLLCRFKTMYRS